MTRDLGIFAGVILTVAVLSAATLTDVPAAEDAPRSAVLQAQTEAQRIAAGKRLYVQNCMHCHGLNMVNPGNVTFDLREFPRDEKARFVESVTRGKNNMPPWRDVLSADEIDALWAYVRAGGQS
ncbi:MAG: cytochrome c [Pseudonocardiales bacterium]|nr:cytochrome c [Hyphomicrobiales bacterium]MBV8825534.1 cytochrome c [Hyphomicrobiales bacterium]MBV9429460.1 cytochrome c [Bradyrhizobiaceae bacterium]MBV9728128.1 cytochrome c [Pseudonocardiales bacterium]